MEYEVISDPLSNEEIEVSRFLFAQVQNIMKSKLLIRIFSPRY